MQLLFLLSGPLCLSAGLLMVTSALPALGQTTQWSEPARTEQWSTAPAQKPATAQGKAESGTDQGAACPRGAKIEVLSAGKWYPAKVLDGPDRMGTCLVSYDGYGSNWDEWVNASRMRRAAVVDGPVAKPAPAAPRPEGLKPEAAASGVPAGTYACYTFDAGQLNYTYTDVVVRSDGRYAVGNAEGRFTLSRNGALAFTGPLANAAGKFALKGGKPQIDLVFNGNALSSMSCPKTK